uniref:Uncharacterized protein n=1 Tax=Talaromyces marneffei PM1 TaxID=1077442 RepID=A0A093UTD7_TALMA
MPKRITWKQDGKEDKYMYGTAIDHCFDYIRQSLMCAGDTSIAGEDFPGGSYQFEVVHVCRNWDQIYDWLDANRASDKWQFGEEELSWVPPD